MECTRLYSALAIGMDCVLADFMSYYVGEESGGGILPKSYSDSVFVAGDSNECIIFTTS